MSEASPTLGCSIMISCDIYVSVGMSVVTKMCRQDNVAQAHAQSHFWHIKVTCDDIRVIDFDYALEQL